MVGYRNLPEKTAEALDDEGWLHTGDVATIDEDGYVTLIDRKKELIINAAGKNMSPANIEATLKGSSPLIGQACVIGDGRRYNTALLVLDADYAPAWAARQGIEGELARDERVLAAVQEGVDAANADALDPGADQALHPARRRLAARRRRADADDEAQAPPDRRQVRRRRSRRCTGNKFRRSADKSRSSWREAARLLTGNRPLLQGRESNAQIRVVARQDARADPHAGRRRHHPGDGSSPSRARLLIRRPPPSPSSQQRTAVEALKVDATTGGALDMARSAAAVLGSSTSRADTVGAYKGLLGANSKSIMAVFSSTLPNSFDGKDATSVGAPGTDKDGSFGPSVTLTEDGSITAAATADNAKGAAGFVKKPLSGVQEPAAYEGTMYVTYQVPVERAGKVVGFAGTANTLAGLDGQISKTKLLDSGYAFAVSAKGVFVASPDKKNNGKLSLASLAKEKNNAELTQVAESVAAGKSGQIETVDPFTGKDIVLTWSGIDSAGWSFLTAVPVSEVLAPVNAMRTTLLIIGLIMLALVSVVILLVANKLTKPISTVTAAAERWPRARSTSRSTSTPMTRSAAWRTRSRT